MVWRLFSEVQKADGPCDVHDCFHIWPRSIIEFAVNGSLRGKPCLLQQVGID